MAAASVRRSSNGVPDLERGQSRVSWDGRLPFTFQLTSRQTVVTCTMYVSVLPRIICIAQTVQHSFPTARRY